MSVSRAIPVAASRIGVSTEYYLYQLSLGLKWCTACKDWHDRSAFPRDSSRGDGLHAQCRDSRHTEPRSPLERFQEKVLQKNDRGCAEWNGSKYPSGYGSFWFEGRVQVASRVAWLLFRGPIPDGLWVLHECDNPPCVNPDHLFLGTRQDNVDDMDSKGRRASLPGELNPKSKLTAKDVVAIRELSGTKSQRELAAKYGVTKTAIRLIQQGKNWSHV